jgi:hypothetical protein
MPVVVLGGCVEELLHEAQLAIAADEGRLQRGRADGPAAQPDYAHRTPELQRLGLPLEHMRAGVLEHDRGLGGALGRFADEHRPRLGHGLDAGRRVDEVAGDHALALGAERHRRLAREHPDARAELGRSDLDAERPHRVEQVERGANGPLGVVLACHRRSPDGHDGVADELLDRSPVAFDDCAGRLEVAGEKLADVFGVATLGE